MDENDSLSEYNKFAIVPVAPFTPKSTSKFFFNVHIFKRTHNKYYTSIAIY